MSCTSRRTPTRAARRLEEHEIDPNLTILAILTTAIGYLMVVAGLHKSLLEWRRHDRKCPSCGRHISERVCAYCTR